MCLPSAYCQLALSQEILCYYSSKRRIVLRYQRKRAKRLPSSVKVVMSTDSGSMHSTMLQTWVELRNIAVRSLEVGSNSMTRENGDVFGL